MSNFHIIVLLINISTHLWSVIIIMYYVEYILWIHYTEVFIINFCLLFYAKKPYKDPEHMLNLY